MNLKYLCLNTNYSNPTNRTEVNILDDLEI